MANLFELLSGLKDKVQDKAQDSMLYNRLVGNNTGSDIEIDPVILDNNGNIDYAGILEAKQKTTPTTLKEKLFGRNMSLNGTKINQNDDGTYSTDLETYSNRRPGLLSDISSGYKENRFNPIAISNLTDNTTQDGRQKGFAYRLGEGLGSLARLAESPIGRGLLMGGTVLATNGTPLQALSYGTATAASNQGNRLRDNTYRQQLEAEGIDTSKLGSGYLTDTTYQNTINTANKRKELEKKDRELDLQEEENKRKQIDSDYKNIQAQYDIMEKAIKLPYLDAQTRIEIEQEIANLKKTAKEIYGIDLTNEHREQDNYFNPILKSQEIAKNTQDYQWQPKLNQSIINRNNNAVDNSIALARLALAQNADNRANTKLQMDIDDKKKKDEERDAVTNAVKNLTGGNNTNTANRTGKKDNDPLGIR